jgi:hypothetical protein
MKSIMITDYNQNIKISPKLQEIVQENKRFLTQIRKKSNLRNLLILALLWSVLTFNFYLIVFYVGKMSGNIYLNTFTSNL